MQVKISDLCVAVVAVAVGARFSRDFPKGPITGPLANPLGAMLELGGLVLCPLILLKQFFIERRTQLLRFGEWLWIVSFAWTLCLITRAMTSGQPIGFLACLYMGPMLLPILFGSAFVRAISVTRRVGNRDTMWTDIAGCVVTAVFSFSVLWAMV
jgi:hypothetical protein